MWCHADLGSQYLKLYEGGVIIPSLLRHLKLYLFAHVYRALRKQPQF